MNRKCLSCLCTSISTIYFLWESKSILSICLDPYFCQGSFSPHHLCFIHTCLLRGLFLEQITHLPEETWAKLTGCLLQDLTQTDIMDAHWNKLRPNTSSAGLGLSKTLIPHLMPYRLVSFHESTTLGGFHIAFSLFLNFRILYFQGWRETHK